MEFVSPNKIIIFLHENFSSSIVVDNRDLYNLTKEPIGNLALDGTLGGPKLCLDFFLRVG